jgi:4-hydroxybenzoate polyprenyltransferase
MSHIEVNSSWRASAVSHYIHIARPDHCIKNIFVLPGVASALAFARPTEALWTLPLAFIATCLVASANYTINEYLDAEYDRFHPTKSSRPGARGVLDWRLVFLQYAALAATGISISIAINPPFLIASLALLLMGILYNVPPIRTKDHAYLDVLSESVNNPIRFLLGWFAITSDYFPPSSILLAYWMGGAYLMGIKRFSEYRRIGDSQTAALYRRSFASYSEQSLLLSAFFYAICAAFFLGIFLIKYRVEFVLTFPLFAALFTWYLSIGLQSDSAAQAPEKLYREMPFLVFSAALFATTIVLFYTDIPLLAGLTDTHLIAIDNGRSLR